MGRDRSSHASPSQHHWPGTAPDRRVLEICEVSRCANCATITRKVTTLLLLPSATRRRSLRLSLRENNQIYENKSFFAQNRSAARSSSNVHGRPCARGYLFVDKLPIRHRRCSAAHRLKSCQS